MRRILIAGACAAVAAAGGVYYAGGDPPGPERADVTPADPLAEKTALLEQELAREQRNRARGQVQDEDVDRARVELAKARHDLALRAGDRAEMLTQCRVILAVWEREWQRLGPAVEHGTLTPAEADPVRRRLAVARYRVAVLEGREDEAHEQLRLAAEVCDREAARLTQGHARRVVGLGELNAARNRATCARYLVARSGGRSDEVRREVDRTVALWEGEAERAGRLYQAGAAHFLEDHEARLFLTDARIRRATLDGDRGAVAEQLRARIALREKALPRLDATDLRLRRLRPGTEWRLERDRLALERLERDGTFPPDTAAAELDG